MEKGEKWNKLTHSHTDTHKEMCTTQLLHQIHSLITFYWTPTMWSAYIMFRVHSGEQNRCFVKDLVHEKPTSVMCSIQ